MHIDNKAVGHVLKGPNDLWRIDARFAQMVATRNRIWSGLGSEMDLYQGECLGGRALKVRII